MTTPLKDIPIFSRLDAEERAELEEILEPVSFSAGETIFEEGGPEDYLYVVCSGIVEVHKKVLPGHRHVLATVSAPTVVGEMGLLTEPRAAATVTARTNIEAHGINRDRFLEMLDGDSLAACKVVYEIGRTLSERMAKTDESIAHIIARIERADTSHDLDVFQDTLLNEWSF
ncbi:MAG TPA: cyclic nucleotide-binding domain-containing protein [Rubrobacteraceae bacterium]|nr:cyclic nucleotide-binding domain-containing protein [Rubrobacteraceae bacterium]